MTKMLIINPGSTSTKLALYQAGQLTSRHNIDHGSEMVEYKTAASQLPLREKIILSLLAEEKADLAGLDAIVGRGGLLHPLAGGVYRVNEDMVKDLEEARYGWHSCNLGALLALKIANRYQLEAFIADPVIVDELSPLARISGWPEIERRSIFHALNQKAAGRTYAEEVGRNYEDLNLIIAHMGGGISVGVHQKGSVIDVNNALEGEGPFTPERTGGLPLAAVFELCAANSGSENILRDSYVGKGGLYAYLATNDAREIERRIEAGDQTAALIYEAMVYQVAKEIGSAAAVLKGQVDAVLLTGGLSFSKTITAWLKERVAFIAPIRVYPGEDELMALAKAVEEALAGTVPIREYKRI